jgi:hypothetical protein
MSNEHEENIPIKEEADGSVTVELPDSVQVAADDDQSDKTESSDVPGDDDPPNADELDSLRAARRERRRAKKDLVRKTQAEKDERLQLLQRQNQELMERLAVVEQRTHANDLAQIDKAMQDGELRVRYAKMKLAEAVQAQDGEAAAQANEMLLDERQKLEALKNFKQKAVQPQQKANIPDASVQKQIANWMQRNPWFDPERKDMDSKIAKQIDEQLNAEGWNPATREYWDEMDNRLRKYIPHQYNDDYEDDSPRRRPRSAVTSSGRENAASAGGRQTFMLTPDQVKAMKDAGFWDDPKKRMSMIKRYAEQKSQNPRS